MANALAVLDQGRPTLPAELAEFFEEESNVAPKSTTPSLGVTGKIWTIAINGEKTKLMRRDPETGDETPVSVFRAVILDYAKRRGRAYYEGSYDPDNVASPICWSDDGVKPDQTVTQKQHPTCEGCPMAAKGSKVTDNNKSVTACSQHRMVAVVPAGKLDFTPLRLKLAVTSDWDKDRKIDDGYMGFQQFTDTLRAKKVPHTAMLVTKMKFDPDVAYPKVLFAVDSWLDREKLKQITAVVKSDAVKNLLDGTYTPNGVDGAKKDPAGTTSDTAAPSDENTAKAAEAKKAADAAAVVASTKAATEKAAADAAATAKAAQKAAKKAEKDRLAQEPKDAADRAAAAAAAPDDEDDGEVLLPSQTGGETAKVVSPVATPPATNGAAATPVTAAKAADVPSDVSALLAEWGND